MKFHAIPAALLAAASLAHATTEGYDTDPLGSRDGMNIGYALWDTFSASSFSYTSPLDGSGSSVFSAAMKSDTSGGMVLGDGDRLYQFGNPFSFTINGGTATGADAAVVQLKFTSPSAGDPLEFFTLTLNNTIAPTSVSLFDTVTEGTNTFNIVTYSWTNLGLTAGSQVKFTISSLAEHVSIDGFSVDVSAVPEPSVYGIAAVLLLAAVIWRRRGALRRVA